MTVAPAHLSLVRPDRDPVRYRSWQREAVVYEVYWRRFAGNAQGIIDHLDYLQELGVTCLWTTPPYESDWIDSGYDIKNYKALHPDFAADDATFTTLIAEAQKRGMIIMMDLVFNHVSKSHPWFKEALQGGPKRDWFIWREGRNKNTEPPDNQKSAFGGPAWHFDPEVGLWGMHRFAEEQRDLNWANPEVRAAAMDIMRHWIGRGVRGFRFDALDEIDKSGGGGHLGEYMREMYHAVLKHHDLLTVAEMPAITPEQTLALTHPKGEGVDMVFDFDFPRIRVRDKNKYDPIPWTVPQLKQTLGRVQRVLHGVGWTSIYLGNHDWSRIVSRFGNDTVFREQSAKLFATLQFTLQGTPCIYQGEELGLANTVYPSIEDYEDLETRNFYYQSVANGMPPSEALRRIQDNSRDAARGPMPWPEAERQQHDATSVFSYYKRLTQIRRQDSAFVYGEYNDVASPPDVYAYTRKLGETTLLTILNVSESPNTFRMPHNYPVDAGELLLHNDSDIVPHQNNLRLKPYEARVYRFVTPQTPRIPQIVRTVKRCGTRWMGACKALNKPMPI